MTEVGGHELNNTFCCDREADSPPLSEWLSLWKWQLGEFHFCFSVVTWLQCFLDYIKIQSGLLSEHYIQWHAFCRRYKQTRRLCFQRKPKDNEEAAETEDTGALLDLLSCPHSPWMYDESWSPQAPALRQLAVLAPERLHAAFIYSYFTTLRIVDKGVSAMIFSFLKIWFKPLTVSHLTRPQAFWLNLIKQEDDLFCTELKTAKHIITFTFTYYIQSLTFLWLPQIHDLMYWPPNFMAG